MQQLSHTSRVTQQGEPEGKTGLIPASQESHLLTRSLSRYILVTWGQKAIGNRFLGFRGILATKNVLSTYLVH